MACTPTNQPDARPARLRASQTDTHLAEAKGRANAASPTRAPANGTRKRPINHQRPANATTEQREDRGGGPPAVKQRPGCEHPVFVRKRRSKEATRPPEACPEIFLPRKPLRGLRAMKISSDRQTTSKAASPRLHWASTASLAPPSWPALESPGGPAWQGHRPERSASPRVAVGG